MTACEMLCVDIGKPQRHTMEGMSGLYQGKRGRGGGITTCDGQ